MFWCTCSSVFYSSREHSVLLDQPPKRSQWWHDFLACLAVGLEVDTHGGDDLLPLEALQEQLSPLARERDTKSLTLKDFSLLNI